MDQIGAVWRALLVATSVARTHHFGPAFLWLGVPAGGAFIALLFARAARPNKGTPPPAPSEIKLPNVFWIYVAAAGLLALGFVDFPLLAYHFQEGSLVKPEVIPLLYAGAMGVNGLTALIFGRLFDRYGIQIIVVGILVSLLALPFGFLGGASSVYCQRCLLGHRFGCPGCDSAIGNLTSRVNEQTRVGVRGIQRSLRRPLVSGERHDGRALRLFALCAGGFWNRRATRCRPLVCRVAQAVGGEEKCLGKKFDYAFDHRMDGDENVRVNRYRNRDNEQQAKGGRRLHASARGIGNAAPASI